MTTRATIRTSLRERLGEPASGGFWTDAELNTNIANATQAYAIRMPTRSRTAQAIVANTSSYTVPADCLTIKRVEDQNGIQLTNRTPENPRRMWDTLYGWFQEGRQLIITPAPTYNQTVTLTYIPTRTPVTDDVAAIPIEPGDELILLALAEADAWNRRAGHEAARGINGEARRREESARREADQLIKARSRRAVGSSTT